MSKRTKIVIKTKEGEALRRLRELRGLSVRKVGDLLNISHTMVNHLEIGRANITDEYVSKFLAKLNFNQEDWSYFLLGPTKNKQGEVNNIIQECIRKIKILPEDKLRVLEKIISNL